MRGLVAAVVLALAGCAPTAQSTTRKPPPVATGRLTVRCPVDDARVWLDEALVGGAPMLRVKPLVVAAGAHRVTVRADGHYAAYLDVEVAANAERTLDVALVPVPPGEKPDEP
jgi:hypothetical protein